MPFLSAHMGFPHGSDSKESACNAGDPGLIRLTLVLFSSFHLHPHSWEVPFYLHWNSWICSSMKTDYPFLQMYTVNFYLWILSQWILMLGILFYHLLFKYPLLANLRTYQLSLGTGTYRDACSITQLCLTLWTLWNVAHQAPLTMGFPRQECWSGLPFPFPEV